ncbi:hypothetical protein EYC84_005876 [Monilinia fructicola]|uniref:Uncharacterized protein n=1 Tax=Monilinia fructicola TaxID=38448 RepID=A0A5M9K0H9_MONFR|nr:hypothetical protein EYC84_005876 [Monilinia fructicola]
MKTHDWICGVNGEVKFWGSEAQCHCRFTCNVEFSPNSFNILQSPTLNIDRLMSLSNPTTSRDSSFTNIVRLLLARYLQLDIDPRFSCPQRVLKAYPHIFSLTIPISFRLTKATGLVSWRMNHHQQGKLILKSLTSLTQQSTYTRNTKKNSRIVTAYLPIH